MGHFVKKPSMLWLDKGGRVAGCLFSVLFLFVLFIYLFIYLFCFFFFAAESQRKQLCPAVLHEAQKGRIATHCIFMPFEATGKTNVERLNKNAGNTAHCVFIAFRATEAEVASSETQVVAIAQLLRDVCLTHPVPHASD